MMLLDIVRHEVVRVLYLPLFSLPSAESCANMLRNSKRDTHDNNNQRFLHPNPYNYDPFLSLRNIRAWEILGAGQQRRDRFLNLSKWRGFFVPKTEIKRTNLMAKTNSAPLSGMRDFLPLTVLRRNYVIDIIEQVYQSYGFEPLETPVMERLSTLLG